MVKLRYLDLLTKKYADKGRGPDNYDCWGLVIEMYRRSGRNIPDYESPATADSDKNRWVQIHNPRIPGGRVIVVAIAPGGDGVVTHTGVIVDDGRFIHASEKKGIVIEPLGRYENFIEGYYEYAG